MVKFPRVKFPAKKFLKFWRLIPVFFVLGLFAIYFLFLNNPASKTPDPGTAFAGEVYDKIVENYWEKISEQKLAELFFLATEKLEGTQSAKLGTVSKPANKKEVLNLVSEVTKDKDPGKKKEFLVNLAGIVLANLQPFGRSGLYTQKLEQQLKNTVNNINPEKDLYKDLGLPKNASEGAVEQAFNNLPEEKKKNKEIAYAKETLTDKDTKARYDQSGVEPTISTKLLTPDIAYLQFKKFSPTSLDEFQKGLNSLDKEGGPKALIFDLRGNVGGAIDATAFFLGNFLGINQYAYDFYQKGEFKPFKTQLDQLPVMKRLRQIVVLVDNQTQSSAELMASGLKKYRMGIVVGVPTKGWGTVEKVFPLEHQIDETEKYSVFLVHSITLRDDNQPIEGRGVEPNVNINDKNWEENLESYVRYPQLVTQVKQILTKPQ